MTELYIDKQLVVLPETFSITIVEENPFFTKNGKYSYDITLSLLDPINARIYKHLNRINKKVAIPQNRSAYLLVDNEVVLNGTEVILEHTDKEVKIQLVSGNSELNFLIGGDLKLRDLDLGKAEKYTGENWMEVAKKVYLDLNKTYPERDWILTPYTAGYDTNISIGFYGHILNVGNFYALPNITRMPDIEQDSMAYPEYQPSFSGQVPQPYLCFIIRRILESLGYSLEYNALEYDAIRKQSYIVHGFRTLKFAKMLPDWTVIEFFENLELWLDATTVINPYKKTVRIEFNYKNTLDENGIVKIDQIDILDEYTVEHDEDNTPVIQSSNVAYDLDEDDYYRYMNIGFQLRNTDQRESMNSLSDLLSRIESNPSDETLFEYIYTIEDSDYIAFKIKDAVTIKKIDSFRPLMNSKKDSEDIDISLKIIPASFVYTTLSTSGKTARPPHSVFWVQVPVAEEFDDLSSSGAINEDNEEEIVEKISSFQDAIEEGSGDIIEKGGSKMRLALYTGLKFMNRKTLDADSGIHSARYPMPFVESLYEDFPESKEEMNMARGYNPFRLEQMNEDIYKHTQVIDMNKIHKLSFINNEKKDVTAVFIANNKKYRCAKIERVVTERGFDLIAKGEFYPHQDKEVLE